MATALSWCFQAPGATLDTIMTSQHRRNVLKLLLAAPLTACQLPARKSVDKRVIVVGAGIIGASVAYHLAKAGASVTVIDKSGPATHASRGTLAWLNASWAKQPRYYHALNQAGIAGWRRLCEELTFPIRWGGSLEWFQDPARQAKLSEQIIEQAQWGEPARMIGAGELAALEPHVHLGRATQAAWSGNDGAVDPVATTQALLGAAKANGAEIAYPCELLGVDEDSSGGLVLATTMGTMRADRIVLATGAAMNTAEKFAESPIPQRTTPGIIAITRPMPRVANHVLAGPGLALHQRDDGRIVMGEHDGPPDTEAHALRLDGRPNDFPARELAIQHAKRIQHLAQAFLPPMAKAEFEHVYIGWRPLPLDGHPVIGPSPRHPNIYLAVMHSGVTLAPVVGELVAKELLPHRTVPELSRFRPGREFALVKRY